MKHYISTCFANAVLLATVKSTIDTDNSSNTVLLFLFWWNSPNVYTLVWKHTNKWWNICTFHNCGFDSRKYPFCWLHFTSPVKLHLQPSNPQLTPPYRKIHIPAPYNFPYIYLANNIYNKTNNIYIPQRRYSKKYECAHFLIVIWKELIFETKTKFAFYFISY
jgi:hypothetical protein